MTELDIVAELYKFVPPLIAGSTVAFVCRYNYIKAYFSCRNKPNYCKTSSCRHRNCRDYDED